MNNEDKILFFGEKEDEGLLKERDNILRVLYKTDLENLGFVKIQVLIKFWKGKCHIYQV